MKCRFADISLKYKHITTAVAIEYGFLSGFDFIYYTDFNKIQTIHRKATLSQNKTPYRASFFPIRCCLFFHQDILEKIVFT